MNWLVWRQHRKQLLIFAGLLLVFIAIAVPSGLRFWHEYQQLISSCAQNCNEADLRRTVFKIQFDGLVVNFVTLTLLGLPILLGLFLGVPLLAKEYAEKTNKLVWTQGISRKKWLTSKILWVLLATIVYAGIFSAVATWFSKTGNDINHDRFSILAFSSQGIVPVAIAVFAVSLGVMFGTWFKKVLPAIGATLGFMLVLQIAVPLLVRTHYAAPTIHKTHSLFDGDKQRDPLEPQLPGDTGAWVVGDKLVNNSGQVFDWASPPSSCKIADPSSGSGETREVEKRPSVIARNNVFVNADCLNALGYHWEIKYQPSYRYWNFQRIEAGLYVALSLAAIGGTYLLVLKRDA